MEAKEINTEDKSVVFEKMMKMYNKNHIIHIAMDAGFDGGKVCVNGMLYNVPFCIYDITGKEEAYKLTRIKDSFIKCEYENGVYVLGEAAKTALLRSDNDKNVDSSTKELFEIGRYYKKNFRIALNGFVGYALYRYAKLTEEHSDMDTFSIDNIDDWHIIVGIAVPHSQRDELPDVIDKYLLEPKHEYKLTVGEEVVSFNYTVENTYYNSQAYCVFINEATTDMCEEVEEIYRSLPALIEDGGYKTQGEFTYEKDETISGGVSNTDFAMMNINERVAQRISEYVDGYTDYMIDELCRENESIRYLDEETKISHTLDVCKIKEEEIGKMAEKMISHLCEDYGNLLKHKLIIFAGGTGKTYYPYVNKWCKTYRPDIIVRLAGDNAENTFNGNKVDPVFAVVCGLFKVGTEHLGITEEEIKRYIEDVESV